MQINVTEEVYVRLARLADTMGGVVGTHWHENVHYLGDGYVALSVSPELYERLQPDPEALLRQALNIKSQ